LLPGQLLGRLRENERSGVQSLLEQARQWKAIPWLRPIAPSLSPAGGPLRRTFTGHSQYVSAVAVTPDGRCAISASGDTTLKVWNLQSGTLLYTLSGHHDSIEAIAVTPDGRRVISASQDNTLKVWDPDTGTELHTLGTQNWHIGAEVLLPDGRRGLYWA